MNFEISSSCLSIIKLVETADVKTITVFEEIFTQHYSHDLSGIGSVGPSDQFYSSATLEGSTIFSATEEFDFDDSFVISIEMSLDSLFSSTNLPAFSRFRISVLDIIKSSEVNVLAHSSPSLNQYISRISFETIDPCNEALISYQSNSNSLISSLELFEFSNNTSSATSDIVIAELKSYERLASFSVHEDSTRFSETDKFDFDDSFVINLEMSSDSLSDSEVCPELSGFPISVFDVIGSSKADDEQLI
jgi:hypothetical protein